jgi:hypothetical protein
MTVVLLNGACAPCDTTNELCMELRIESAISGLVTCETRDKPHTHVSRCTGR